MRAGEGGREGGRERERERERGRERERYTDRGREREIGERERVRHTIIFWNDVYNQIRLN